LQPVCLHDDPLPQSVAAKSSKHRGCDNVVLGKDCLLLKGKKCRAIPVTGREGLKTSRLPHFLNNRLTEGGDIVSLMYRPLERFLVLISVRG
jgi:hypothetical protein